jgi:hypothetical protein
MQDKKIFKAVDRVRNVKSLSRLAVEHERREIRVSCSFMMICINSLGTVHMAIYLYVLNFLSISNRRS